MDVETLPEDEIHDQLPASEPVSVTTGLFLPSSDDEDDKYPIAGPSSPIKKKRPVPLEIPDDSDDDIILLEDVPRASSVSAFSERPSTPSTSPAPDRGPRPPPTKKRRVSPRAGPSNPLTFIPTYIGEFLIPNAWSNVSGKGYIKRNETVRIERDRLEDSKDSLKAAGSGKKKGEEKKGKGKQLSLATMLKAQPVKSSKKKQDSIVRLLNSRGVGEWPLKSLNGQPLSR